MSSAEEAGIGVGVSIGSILLITLGAFGAFIWFRRKGSRSPLSETLIEATKPELDGEGVAMTETELPPELEQPPTLGEMSSGSEGHEAPSAHIAEMGRSLSRKPFSVESRHELPDQ